MSKSQRIVPVHRLDWLLMLSDCLGTAAAECVSEEALVHLKSYKYSSVDKSLISHYILRHYVRLPSTAAGDLTR